MLVFVFNVNRQLQVVAGYQIDLGQAGKFLCINHKLVSYTVIMNLTEIFCFCLQESIISLGLFSLYIAPFKKDSMIWCVWLYEVLLSF